MMMTKTMVNLKCICPLLFLVISTMLTKLTITILTYLAREALGTPILNTSSLHGLECRTFFKRDYFIVDGVVLMFTRNVEEEKEDTAVKLSRMFSGSFVLVLLEMVVVWLDKLVVGRRTVEIFGRSTDRVGVVRRGGFGGVTNLISERFWFCA